MNQKQKNHTLIKNLRTGYVTYVRRQYDNGDVVIHSPSGYIRIGIDELQDHWEDVKGCPTCDGTGKVFNITYDRYEACKVCYGKNREGGEE